MTSNSTEATRQVWMCVGVEVSRSIQTTIAMHSSSLATWEQRLSVPARNVNNDCGTQSPCYQPLATG